MRKISFHPLPSPTDCPLVIPNRKRSALDWGSRDYSLDSRFRGNDTFFVIPHLMRDPSPPVIPNRKRSASDWGSIPSRHPQFDWGSSPDWIPVFTEMTHHFVILNRKQSPVRKYFLTGMKRFGLEIQS